MCNGTGGFLVVIKVLIHTNSAHGLIASILFDSWGRPAAKCHKVAEVGLVVVMSTKKMKRINYNSEKSRT